METSIDPRPDRAARRAGWLLLLTAAATVVAVAGRVSAGADLETLEESLAAIGATRGSYGLGGAARLLSGITLAVGAATCCGPGSCASGSARARYRSCWPAPES